MKVLHTSDWHLGKTLRGHSRLAEQEAVLSEIVSIAADESVDLALVVGDVFETAMPRPDAQELAWRTLLGLQGAGARVVVIAGNHDNPWVFDALRPLAAAAGITILGHPLRPEDGGLLGFESRSGVPVRLALLPFCSQRGVVAAAQLLAGDAGQNAGMYADRMAAVLGALTKGFSADSVNLLAAHCMVRGGLLGGGERDAQSVEDYWVSPAAFGGAAHYVALGHLHLTQRLAGGCPIWYSGSPIQVDFGEEGDAKYVLIVEANPGVPVGQPRKVPLQAPRRLRTIRGNMNELSLLKGSTGNDLLRVYVEAKARAGLADELREMFPLAVDVFVTADPGAGTSGKPSSDRARSPRELFSEYLAKEGVADVRVERLFARLLDEETTGMGVGG